MTVIVTDDGFTPEYWTAGFDTPEALDLPSDTNPETLEGKLQGIEMIRVQFPQFADGRGFSIARALRRMGYDGPIRAAGHVLADQYAMARRSGFDEVEIDDDLAARQPEDQWLFRSDWRSFDYRTRLRSA